MCNQILIIMVLDEYKYFLMEYKSYLILLDIKIVNLINKFRRELFFFGIYF